MRLRSLFLCSLALGLGSLSACSPAGSGALPVAPPVVTPPLPALESPFEQAPDLTSCQPGRLKAAVVDRVLERVNRFRAQHGLPAVVHDTTRAEAAQAAALMMGSNTERSLSHNPGPDWRCFSEAGQTGAQNGGLSRGRISGTPDAQVNPEAMVDRFMSELSSNSPSGDLGSIGHRRWLLNPFLKRIAVGWVESRIGDSYSYSGSLWWTDSQDFVLPSASTAEFVAYPHGAAYPSSAFDPAVRLSFSVLADTSSLWNNDGSRVDLAGAQVQMSGGAVVQNLARAVTDPNTPNASTEGLPNVLVWRAAGMQRGVQYTVNVRGVKLKVGNVWQNRDYQYTFQGQ